MSEHDKLLKAMAEVTGLALDGHGVSINVHGVGRDEFLAFRDRHDSEIVRVETTHTVTGTVFGEPFGPGSVLVTMFLDHDATLVDSSGPLVADEESEDPRDEQFDREAGFYEGWKGPGA